ncbi:MAG: PQQ-dependent sugar dehydrogenase [Chloroflexi bacterium]|nr:PQQ-dependent sugar dehydrogenase [Chloroflexota bacterium]
MNTSKFILVFIAFGLTACASNASEIRVPAGFAATVFASGLNRPSSLAFGSDQRLYVAQQNGDILAINAGGAADPAPVARFGATTLGIAFRPNTRELYASTTGRVAMARQNADGSFSESTILVSGLPTGRHQNDQIAFAPDGNFFYLGVGSTCDACTEADPRSGSIMRISADGKSQTVFARGVRNPFGLALHPQTGELFATDNGRDEPLAGVPDELNVIVANGNYGWSPCWGRGQGTNCAGTIEPIAELQAHSSANGFAFYSGENFPAEYRGNVFVALWGGNLPAPGVGKRVDRIVLNRVDGKWQGVVSEFASGFDHPLAVAMNPRDGVLFVADHGNGKIYRIAWTGR